MLIVIAGIAPFVVGWGATETSVIAFFILFLPTQWMSVCNAARRLHDAGHSGWWQLIGGITVTSLIAASFPRSARQEGLYLFLAALGVMLVGAIVLGALKSQPTSNRFGPVEGEEVEASVFD